MALSQHDEDWVKLISEKIVYRVTKEVIANHIASCPHGKSMLASKWLVIGVCIGSGLAGGGAGAVLTRMLMSV